MLMLVTYDVDTTSRAGRRRLRRVARACLDFGQRVQFSVFECNVDPAQWTALRNRLISEIEPSLDSLRFYRMGTSWQHKVEHIGAKPATDLEGPLIL